MITINNSTIQCPTGISIWTNPILMIIIIIAIIGITLGVLKLILWLHQNPEFDKTEEVAGYGK